MSNDETGSINETLKLKKYNKKTCPKDMRWVEQGGKCGWAHACRDCEEYTGWKV